MIGKKKPIRWSGCWEQRPDRLICRWIVSWVHSEAIFGAIGGYSGGGSFQLEKFLIPSCGDVIIEANENLSNLISIKEMELCEDCLDKALSFHYRTSWLQAETLYLKKSAVKTLRSEGDLFFGGSVIDFNYCPLFNAIGLITKPVLPHYS